MSVNYKHNKSINVRLKRDYLQNSYLIRISSFLYNVIYGMVFKTSKRYSVNDLTSNNDIFVDNDFYDSIFICAFGCKVGEIFTLIEM